MNTASPLAAPAAWNAVAEAYAVDFVPVFEQFARDALTLARLPPGAHVLDVAAGPGSLALLAAREAERVVALDFAETMVEALRRRADEQQVLNVEAHTGDGQALPMADASFDAAFSMFGLMFFPDRAAGFLEMRRVLRPEGRAVVSSWAPLDRAPLLDALFASIRTLVPEVPFGTGKAPLADAEEFREEMRAAGFREVEVHTVEHASTVASVRAFWEVQQRSSAPIVLLKKQFDAGEWDAFGQEIIARLESEFGAGPLTSSWPARLGTGVR